MLHFLLYCPVDILIKVEFVVVNEFVSTAGITKDNVSTAGITKDNVSTAGITKDNACIPCHTCLATFMMWISRV